MPSDFGGLGFEQGVLLVVAVLALALILVPLLLFGVELLIVGCVLAASLVGRVVFRRPWLVEARTVGRSGRVLEWKVSGWGRSRRLIDEVVSDLAAGREPRPDTAPEPELTV